MVIARVTSNISLHLLRSNGARMRVHKMLFETYAGTCI